MSFYCDKEHAYNKVKVSEVSKINSARAQKKEQESAPPDDTI